MPERSIEDLEAALARLRSENRRLQKENQALRQELGPIARQEKPAVDDAGQVNGVTNHSGVDQKIRLFRSLFRGREDVYPVRWENQKGRAGYSPACGNEWHKSLCGKPKVKCGTCPNSQFLPVTDQVIHDHLIGKQTIGVYPILEDELEDSWTKPEFRNEPEPHVAGDMPESVKLVLSNGLRIPKQGMPPSLQNTLIRLAAFQNPEFYGHDIGITDRIQKAAPGNIHVLNNEVLDFDGLRFLGSTLWTDFELYGQGAAWFSRNSAKRLIEDFTSIRNGARRFTPEDSVELHEASKAWLVSELKNEFDGPTVVVTHHLPASPSIATQYKNDLLNPAFASRLEGIIEEYQPDLWIHGHTHVPCDYEILGTRVVCNPRGYPSESSARGFLPELVVEV